VLHPRSGRLLVLGPVTEPDDPDRPEMRRDAEPVQQLALPVRDAEEPSAEPLLHRGEQHQHRGHRRVDLPEPHGPVRFLVHAELDLVGLCVAIEIPLGVGKGQDQRRRPVRDGLRLPAELRIARRLPEHGDRLRRIEHQELESLREARGRRASTDVDDAVDDVARHRPLIEAAHHPSVPDHVAEFHRVERNGPATGVA